MLRAGAGELRVNGEPAWVYFERCPRGAGDFLRRLLEMGNVAQVLARLDGVVYVVGSSPECKRQARAVAHALARAIWWHDGDLRKMLKGRGYGGTRVRGNK